MGSQPAGGGLRNGSFYFSYQRPWRERHSALRILRSRLLPEAASLRSDTPNGTRPSTVRDCRRTGRRVLAGDHSKDHFGVAARPMPRSVAARCLNDPSCVTGQTFFAKHDPTARLSFQKPLFRLAACADGEWLAQCLHRVPKSKLQFVALTGVYDQLGQSLLVSDFRRRVLETLHQVQALTRKLACQPTITA